MPETEWLSSTDPKPMLEVVRGPLSVRRKVFFGREVSFEGYFDRRTSDRKLRLFACACCRRLWDLLDKDHCKRLLEVGQELGCEGLPDLPLDSARNAVELSERAADESMSAEALRAAAEAADAFHLPAQDYAACYDPGMGPFDTVLMASGRAAYAAYHACDSDPAVGSMGVIREASCAIAYLRSTEYGQMVAEGGDPAERAAHCALLREIMGNPFRSPAIAPAVLAWNGGAVRRFAKAMYDERSFAQMSQLADALEQAGCTDADVIAHCREPGEHVRGCWVVDLILGKE
jgi:hypothetical protein